MARLMTFNYGIIGLLKKGNCMKKSVTILCTAAACLSMAACGSGSSSSSSEGDAGKYLTIAKENDVVSLNTILAIDQKSFDVIGMFTEGLETLDADGNIIGAMAESYEMSDDQLTYTFHLRDANWSNGEPVTANDFVFAWNELAHNGEAEYSYLVTDDGACIKNGNEIVYDGNKDLELGVTAKDDKTLVVELDKRSPQFLSLMVFPSFYPINEEFYKAQGDQYGMTPENLLANGPFKVVEWTKGNTVKVEKNEDYWDADAVKLPGIIVNAVPDFATSALDFENGNTDWTQLNSTLIDRYKDNEAYKLEPESCLWYLEYNFDNKDLQNKNLRKAISTVVDREDLVTNVLKDGSTAMSGFVPTGFTTSPEGKDFVEGMEDVYNKVGDDAVKAAQEYLDKALEELGTDEVTLTLLCDSSDPAKPVAEYIQACTSKLKGLNLELQPQEKANRLAKLKSHDFDLALTGWIPDYSDPTAFLTLMASNNAYNYGSYSSEEYDAKLEEAAAEPDLSKRWKLLQEAEDILMEDVPVVGIYQMGGAVLQNPKVEGIDHHVFGISNLYKNAHFTE